jgi:cysteine desulfurase family protein (TIGR01976 family)
LAAKLSPRTRLVAVGCASNAVGTINPVREIARMAHEVGALVYLDAVHYAPHRPIDVVAWDCDFVACSAYKFFGPHVGMLWARRQLLETLPVYKLRPSSNRLPDRWMTGTQNHEGIAGTIASIDYLAGLGRAHSPSSDSRREALLAAFSVIADYERELGQYLLSELSKLPEVRVWGITDPARHGERVPTLSLTHSRLHPEEMSAALGRQGIFTWYGNYYALPLTEALQLEPEGMLRIGLLHYNTKTEVDRLIEALRGF